MRSTRSIKTVKAASTSTSDCRRFIQAAATEKIDGSRISATPILLAASAIAALSLKIVQAADATVRSISGTGKRQPPRPEFAIPRCCSSEDLAPSFKKRRDSRCRSCFRKRYGSAARDKKITRIRKTKSAK
jgi:hypothetical protein